MTCKACHEEHPPSMPCGMARRIREAKARNVSVTQPSVTVTHKPASVTAKKPRRVTDTPQNVTDKPGRVTDIRVTDAIRVTDKAENVTDTPASVTDTKKSVTDKRSSVTDAPANHAQRQRKYRQVHADAVRARDRERKRAARVAKQPGRKSKRQAGKLHLVAA